ncbi:DNA-binding protein [Methylobacterium sp. Leaf117]|uniref:DNA-binding protein n=1 Tax=Methylobacterium sp. Leaf117 TaxID=1736260 RepID=UPI0007015FD4|nr:DNA-binding protein [Methylobacterium sp. Leaf117]KQP92953.1 hypothetical protein ASF57_22615 [Methylobacterium sp. Leaf117]
MPTKVEVFAGADRLHAKGVRLSMPNVSPELRRGGSNRVVGPLLDWKTERAYPVGLGGRRVAGVGPGPPGDGGGRAWEAAQAKAAELLAGECEEMAARMRASDEVLDEALAGLDVAEAEMGRMRERLERFEDRREMP